MTTLPSHQIALVADIWPKLPAGLCQAIEAHYQCCYDECWAEELEAIKKHYLCAWFEGDVSLNEVSWKTIRDAQEHQLLLLVGGQLDFTGAPPACWIGGDLVCDVFGASTRPMTIVAGKVVARHYAIFSGEDHEILHQDFCGRVDTPYAFFWFHNWRAITLPPDTVAFVMCNRYDFEEPDLPAWFYWMEDLYALKPALYRQPEAWTYDTPNWYFSAIFRTLAAGESIFINGFDIACVPLLHRAAGHRRLKQYKEAFLCAKAAIALSPNYHCAWYSAALALYQANALAQAVPYADRAMALVPEKLAHLHDQAVDELGLALLRLKEWDRVIALTTPLIERTGNGADDDYKAVILRVRGEAWLKKGNLAQARADLENATPLVWENARCAWLAGLVCHRLNDTKRAGYYAKLAAEISGDTEKYAHFDGHDGSDAFYASPVTVDWETLTLADLPQEVRDAGYWRHYLRHMAYESPKHFCAIPAKFLDRDFCLEAIEYCQAGKKSGDIWVAQYFPENVFDDDMAQRLIDLSASNLKYLPSRCITKALLLRAEKGDYDIAYVPAGLIDIEVAYKLVERRVPVDTLPPESIDSALCQHAVRHSSHAVDHVPGRFKDDAFWIAVLAWADDGWFINNRIPSRYLVPATICRALTINFDLIHRLPGRWVDEEVFRHAQVICLDTELWKYLTKVHGQEFRRHKSSAECVRDCWAVYWDEPLILAEIGTEDYHLAAYEIPSEKYTQKIANAAFIRDTIHLGRIPRVFITVQMVEHFAHAYPDMLHDVPLPLRSAKVCEIAAKHSWDNGKYFAHVPKEHRDVGACIIALKKSINNVRYIPLAQRYAVFDRLLAEGGDNDGNEFSRAWLMIQRGLGAMAAGRADEALADFDAVLGQRISLAPRKKSGLLGMLFEHKPQYDQTVSENELASARFCKAWALRYFDRPEDPQLLAQLRDEDHANLDRFDFLMPAEAPDALEFDLDDYEQQMRAAGQQIEVGDYTSALISVQTARQLLEHAQHPDLHLWAYVLDNLRFITMELGLFDENKRLCRQVLDKLNGYDDGPYLDQDNVIRAARRAAHNVLAWRLIDDPQAGRDDIMQALEHARAAQKCSPIENEKDVQCFRETLAKVLLCATALDPSYRSETEAVLTSIRTDGLAEQGLIGDETVLAALRACSRSFG